VAAKNSSSYKLIEAYGVDGFLQWPARWRHETKFGVETRFNETQKKRKRKKTTFNKLQYTTVSQGLKK